MPKGEETLLLGDLIDRGPESKQVVEWAMGNAKALIGNHEHMMIDFMRGLHQYEDGIWFMNGGDATLESYGVPETADIWTPTKRKELFQWVPEEHVKWMESLPTHLEHEAFFFSHAPVSGFFSLEGLKEMELANGSSLVWNRSYPLDMKGKLQVFGHNSNWGYRWLEYDGKPYALCIDSSASKVLTGINTVTLEVFQQPYV
jgi:serine/threonine protein phosphatase 1